MKLWYVRFVILNGASTGCPLEGGSFGLRWGTNRPFVGCERSGRFTEEIILLSSLILLFLFLWCPTSSKRCGW